MLMGALALPPIYLFLATTQVLSNEPVVTLRLCRAFVTPCQQEVNLPVGGEVALALRLDSPDSPAPAQSLSLVAWYLKVLFLGDEAVEISTLRSAGRPFQERGSPDLVLNDVGSLHDPLPQSASESLGYYRISNGYEHGTRTAEYGVTVVAFAPRGQAEAGIRLPQEGRVLIGNINLRGVNAGTTQLISGELASLSPKIVLVDGSGGLSQTELEVDGPLAVINVGTTAEKSRLQGHVWSDLPAGEGSFHPFTGTFDVQFWQPGSVPVWQGGTDHPTVTFTNLTADGEGNYHVPDLTPQLLPAGSYDLRARGAGTLSIMERDVHVDTSGSSGQPLPITVIVNLGPLPSGDLTGDNRVNEEDLTLLKSNFGSLVGRGDAVATGDVNNDGVVDGQDFSLMAANFRKQGE